MKSVCDACRFACSECEGEKNNRKKSCNYYTKPAVFNAKQIVEENVTLTRDLSEAITEICLLCSRKKIMAGCEGCKWEGRNDERP